MTNASGAANVSKYAGSALWRRNRGGGRIMNRYRLNINGREVTGLPDQTILEVARENDIFIPTLCYDERTEIYGSCGICVCEVEGNPKLCKSCATQIAPGMVKLRGR